MPRNPFRIKKIFFGMIKKSFRVLCGGLLVFSCVPSASMADVIYGASRSDDGTTFKMQIHSFNTETKVKTFLSEFTYSEDGRSSYVDNFSPATSNYFHVYNDKDQTITIFGSTDANTGLPGKVKVYNISTDSWSDVESTSGVNSVFQHSPTTGWASTSDVTSNASSITTNASAISSNDTDISTNASAISSNDTDISTNA